MTMMLAGDLLISAGNLLALSWLALVLLSLVPRFAGRIDTGSALTDVVLIAACVLSGAGNVITGQWGWAAANAAVALWIAWDMWRDRRDRGRILAVFGAKSRARIAALVAKMRGSVKPRPVLRPAPGGAR